jgi:hypothetical protein
MRDKNLKVIEITLTFGDLLAQLSRERVAGKTYNNNTTVERGAPQRRGGRASSCLPWYRMMRRSNRSGGRKMMN